MYQHPIGPTISDNKMKCKQPDMLLPQESQQIGPQQWSPRQITRTWCLLFGQAIYLFLFLFWPESLQINHRQERAPIKVPPFGGMDHLDRSTISLREGSTQALVPIHQLLQTTLQTPLV